MKLKLQFRPSTFLNITNPGTTIVFTSWPERLPQHDSVCQYCVIPRKEGSATFTGASNSIQGLEAESRRIMAVFRLRTVHRRRALRLSTPNATSGGEKHPYTRLCPFKTSTSGTALSSSQKPVLGCGLHEEHGGVPVLLAST